MSADKIILLDDITANQIAAGEVVERPMSVVKELCENSLDAGAGIIKTEIENGGQTLIRVTDNGCGMSRTDAVMCLSRHATSKISSSEDLAAISTMGFRGEAIPSIASVSRMVIETSDNTEGKGVRLTVTGGQLEQIEDIAFSRGTRITVRELFYNVPARRKFMKTAASEQTGIVGVLSQLAIGNPNKRFELDNLVYSSGGRVSSKRLLLSAPEGDLLNAIASVLGADTARGMVPFDESDNVCRVYGFVSSPQNCKGTRRDEFLYVNRRSVRNRKLLFMAELPFKTLAPGRFPAVVLCIEAPPSLVDVNVHPAKTEVNFSNESQVSSLIHRAVMKAVSGRVESLELDSGPARESAPASRGRGSGAPSRSFLDKKMSDTGDDSAFVLPMPEAKDDPFDWNAPPEEKPAAAFPSDVKVIGQYRNTYIICSSAEGIMIIDQHVAHERVLYEEFLKHSGDNTWSQMMLMPRTVNCSLKEASIVATRLGELNRAGFIMEEFGGGAFIVRGYPACLNEKNAIGVLEEIIRELSAEQSERKLVVRPDKVYITASCRMAVKAGDALSMQEMQALVEDLGKCSVKNTCPHGRPIIMSVTNYDLDKAFGRI